MYYKKDCDDIPLADTPDATQLGDDHPANYKPDPGLVDAVNVALMLNRPLLLTGDPGTGKTQLAFSVAWQLAGRKALNVSSTYVERFEAKSTSVARDLFYSFDTLGRFQAPYSKGSTENIDYITYNALGRALLKAMPPGDVTKLLPPGFAHGGQTRSIVLIDEIDKAPRDFPNDLLNEIDQMFFRIPELQNQRVGGPDMLKREFFPLVFISSNSEKNLPDPFLRRCIYYNIPFPDRDALHTILLARLRSLMPKPGDLVKDVLDFFGDLRKNNVTSRKISPAELIQWLTFMLKGGADPAGSLKNASDLALTGLSAISKDVEDQQRLRSALKTRLGVR
jgi:MoxR-like ATPase